jgi:hypothetical protein
MTKKTQSKESILSEKAAKKDVQGECGAEVKSLVTKMPSSTRQNGLSKIDVRGRSVVLYCHHTHQ